MAEDWIDKLADDIRERNREAAQLYGRDQHYADVIARRAPEFFVRLSAQLERDVEVLRRKLQGDVTSAETVVQTSTAGQVRIQRERFPWVDATVTLREDSVLVDYAKSAGLAADPQVDRKSRAYALRAAGDDSLYAEEAFAERPERFDSPEALAQSILQLLFGA